MLGTGLIVFRETLVAALFIGITLLNDTAWDSSEFLANDSLLGLFMRGIVSHDASPSQLQVPFYLLAITLIGDASRQMKLKSKSN